MRYLFIILLLILSLSPALAEISITNTGSNTFSDTIRVATPGGSTWNDWPLGSSDFRSCKSMFMYSKVKYNSIDLWSGTDLSCANLYNYIYNSISYFGIYPKIVTSDPTKVKICLFYKDQNLGVGQFVESSFIVDVDGKEHTIGCYAWQDIPNNLIRVRIYLDDETPEDLTIANSTWTYPMVGSNLGYTGFYNLGTNGEMNFTLKECLTLGSLVKGYIPQIDKLYTILRSGHMGQTIFGTVSTPLHSEKTWDGNSPKYSYNGLNADQNYRNRFYQTNFSWNQDFENFGNSVTYIEKPFFFSPMEKPKTDGGVQPGIYCSTNLRMNHNPHDTYFSTVRKRR